MSELIFLIALVATFFFYIIRVGVNLSLSSVALGLIILIHGPFYFIYSRYWIDNGSWIHHWYSDTVGYSSLAASYYEKISADPFLIPALHSLDLAIAILFFGCMAGMWAVDLITRTTAIEYEKCFEEWKRQRFSYTPASLISVQLVITVLICVALIAVYIHYDKFTVVFQYFFSKASEAEKIKWRISNGGFPYILALFLSSIGTFISIYFFSQSNRRGSVLHIASVCLIILVLFGRMAYLSKAPALVFAMQLVLASIVNRTMKPNWIMISGVIVLGLGSMIAMVFVANSDITRFQAALAFVFYRVFMIPNESLLEYFLVFPHRLPHTMGIDNKFVAALAGLEKIPESYYRVAESIRGIGGSTTNGLFIADAWAEFRWWGVVAFPVIFGAILRYIDVLIVKRIGKTPITVAALVTGYYGIFIALNTSLFTACLTGGLALILPSVWIYSTVRTSTDFQPG